MPDTTPAALADPKRLPWSPKLPVSPTPLSLPTVRTTPVSQATATSQVEISQAPAVRPQNVARIAFDAPAARRQVGYRSVGSRSGLRSVVRDVVGAKGRKILELQEQGGL